MRTCLVAEQDWAEAWKEHFGVERYGNHIVVVPTWRHYTASQGDVVIRLDPGMAFGTGQHETTRMCLEALERAVAPGDTVLDLGCGSGILAIAAARLGASEVVALDVDQDAARITAENALLNRVDGLVRVATGSLGERWPFAEPPERRFDIVVANILARVIVELAPDISSILRRGGRLIASGIIAAREAELRVACNDNGLTIDRVRTGGDWRCIEAVGD
jgi:ribosomal protein L11 methyltransferase